MQKHHRVRSRRGKLHLLCKSCTIHSTVWFTLYIILRDPYIYILNLETPVEVHLIYSRYFSTMLRRILVTCISFGRPIFFISLVEPKYVTIFSSKRAVYHSLLIELLITKFSYNVPCSSKPTLPSFDSWLSSVNLEWKVLQQMVCR